jgi:hypothetical protein
MPKSTCPPIRQQVVWHQQHIKGMVFVMSSIKFDSFKPATTVQQQQARLAALTAAASKPSCRHG